MRRWMVKLRPLAAGGVMFGLVQGLGGINYAEILFEFLINWVSILITAVLGGDLGTLGGGIEGIIQ